MTQKQLQGDWEKRLNNGMSCYDFIWRKLTKDCCVLQQTLTEYSYFTMSFKTTAKLREINKVT